jgi:Ser/Thr protein kinase RdoA (MazF antagonist)
MNRLASSREADWRFLLPSPAGGSFEHLVLLGGSRDLVETVLDLGVARRVSSRVLSAADADAVIVLAGATCSIDAAAGALRPDGVLYWEIDRRTSRGVALSPARAIRRLGRYGVTTSAAYWVKPGFPDREMYLPIGATGALRWYLDTLYRSNSVGRRALKALLRALASHSRGLAAFAPCYAVTGVRGTRRQPAVTEAALQRGACSASVDSVFLAHGTAEWSRMAVLLFEPSTRSPSVTLKFARRPAFNAQVDWEHTFLREIAARLPADVRRSLPSSSLFCWNALSVCAQGCVTGAPLSSRTGAGAGQVVDDFLGASRWLADFHQATTLETAPADAWLARRLVAGLCKEYELAFGLTDAERRLFATLARRLDALNGAALPIVWQHTDFGPWNVYRDGDRVSAIDWEVARRGPALVDLLYFATHWSSAITAPGSGEEQAVHFASLFCEEPADGTLAAAIRRGIAEYMHRLQIPSSLLPYLLVYTVLEQVLDRARRFADLRRTDAADHADNRYVRYLRVLAHANTLFPEELPHAA